MEGVSDEDRARRHVEQPFPDGPRTLGKMSMAKMKE